MWSVWQSTMVRVRVGNATTIWASEWGHWIVAKLPPLVILTRGILTTSEIGFHSAAASIQRVVQWGVSSLQNTAPVYARRHRTPTACIGWKRLISKLIKTIFLMLLLCKRMAELGILSYHGWYSIQLSYPAGGVQDHYSQHWGECWWGILLKPYNMAFTDLSLYNLPCIGWWALHHPCIQKKKAAKCSKLWKEI